jgi:hypothetical protein
VSCWSTPSRFQKARESADHFRKAAASPEFQQRTSGMNVRAHPGLYRVVIE